MNKLIFAHININSIRKRFEELISQVKGTADALMISETKIDDSLPIANSLIDGFSQLHKIEILLVVESFYTLGRTFHQIF